MKISINQTLIALAMTATVLATTGCAIKSVDKYGNECVVGQTCPGLLTTKPYTNKVIEGMTVIGVHKPGSEKWLNAIRTDVLMYGFNKDDYRNQVGEKDFVQVRKMGFMYAINHHSGLYTNDLAVGDVVDISIGDKPYDQKIIRVVKRANEGRPTDTAND